MRALPILGVAMLLACGANQVKVTGTGGGTAGASSAGGSAGGTSGGMAAGGASGGAPSAGGTADAGLTCPPLPQPDGGTALMDPTFAANYTFAELGPVPGVPPPLGGCVILQNDRNHLLIAGASERPEGALYRIALRRNACGHIIGWSGTATKIADTPYIDANLLEMPGGSLLYTGWNVSQFSQLKLDAGTPMWTVDLRSRGQMGSSAGGLGRVPPWLAAAGEYRIVGWPDGKWHRLELSVDAGVYGVNGVVDTGVTLTGGPGGFAYVPIGSAQFARPSIILAEWSINQVSVVEVDQAGNPLPSTRRLMFTTFPRPWGAYFEPETGDFLFLTWRGGGQSDSVFIVQGFEKPPPLIE